MNLGAKRWRITPGDLDDAPFTKYQKDKYLKTLRAENWIGLDRNGIYYVRGTRFFLNLPQCKGRSKSASVIPMSALSDNKAWNDFAASAMMTCVARSVLATTTEKQRQRVSMPKTPGKHSTERAVPVSLSIVCEHTGKSQTAAHNARKRAGRSYITITRQLVPWTTVDGNPLKLKRSEMFGFREMYGANFFIGKGGVVFEQLPSLTTLLETKNLKKWY